MKILVGVKMVPASSSAPFIPGINRIDREAGDNVMNPADRGALAAARSLAESGGGEVVACTMGPPAAIEVLHAALAAGADRAVHLIDMRFAGADTLATSRALARLCRRERADLVVLGRIAVDGGTAQVAPQLAELWGVPLVTEATALAMDNGRLQTKGRDAERDIRCSVALPAVVSVDTIRPVQGATGAVPVDERLAGAIETLDADALGGDQGGYGIRGSATYVQRIDPVPARQPEPVVTDAGAAAARIMDLARDAAVARQKGTEPAGGGANAPTNDRDGERPQLWALLEANGESGVHVASLEVLAAAASAGPGFGAEVVAVVLGASGGGSNGESAANEELARLGDFGADRVLAVQSRTLYAGPGSLSPEAVVDALAPLVAAQSPVGVVGPWSWAGRHYVPRTAARLGIGCTGDVVGLSTSPRPGSEEAIDLVWVKPAWSGTVLARVVARTPTSMGTLRPGAVIPVRGAGRPVPVSHYDAGKAGGGGTTLTPRPAMELGNGTAQHVMPEGATVVVCCGAGAAPHVPAWRAFADQAGWSVGGTRRAVELGAVDPAFEIDLERWALSPLVAIVLAPGSADDLRALAGAGTLVTVDSDKEATVHALADVPLGCDPGDLITALAAASARIE